MGKLAVIMHCLDGDYVSRRKLNYALRRLLFYSWFSNFSLVFVVVLSKIHMFRSYTKWVLIF